MTAVIENGDYVIVDGMLKETNYITALLQDITIEINTCRGSFYPDKNFGSEKEKSELQSIYALCCVWQVANSTDGVFVKSVSEENGEFVFTLYINDEERQVQIKA